MVEKKLLEDSKKRFSSRVENYIKYRPKYPLEIIDFLEKKAILAKSTVIADIGSGTGILTKIFLDHGNQVYGVEPNKDMREAAEKILKDYPNFTSFEGSAESTGLEDNSIDLVIAGQAFHWFDVEEAKKEFIRILKPNGYVVLIWNNRGKGGSDFNSNYEKFMLKYGTDYKEVMNKEGNVKRFYWYQKESFYNYQDLDYSSFKGRVLSASYIPLSNNLIFPKMILELEELFNEHQRNGFIRIEYDTKVFYGKLD